MVKFVKSPPSALPAFAAERRRLKPSIDLSLGAAAAVKRRDRQTGPHGPSSEYYTGSVQTWNWITFCDPVTRESSDPETQLTR